MFTKLHKTRLTSSLALLICFTITAVKPTPGQKQVKITGTFSDMHFVKEAGDLLGTEIKIVYAGDIPTKVPYSLQRVRRVSL